MGNKLGIDEQEFFEQAQERWIAEMMTLSEIELQKRYKHRTEQLETFLKLNAPMAILEQQMRLLSATIKAMHDRGFYPAREGVIE